MPASTPTSAWKRWWIVAAALALMGAGWGVGRVLIADRSEPGRLLTVTSMPGAEENPSLSPDGNVVTFSAAGSSTDASHDIWIKAVEGDALRNLTNTPEVMEKYPRFSPDGQYIAFTRYVKGRPSVFKVSALGGAEEMIAADSAEPDWLPDGRSLVLTTHTAEGRAGLVHHVLETGTRRLLTEPPMAFGDSQPRRLPGRNHAWRSRAPAMGDRHSSSCRYLAANPSRSATGTGPERRADVDPRRPRDPGGAAGDERQAAGATEGRVARAGGAVGGRSIRIDSPSVSQYRSGHTYRLAVVSGQQDVGLRLVDLRAPRQGDTITSHSPFCDATRMDTPGRFSPDGRQVAFASDRSGNQQLWVANVDGSALHSVTELQDAYRQPRLVVSRRAAAGIRRDDRRQDADLRRASGWRTAQARHRRNRDRDGSRMVEGRPMDLLRVGRIGPFRDLEGVCQRRRPHAAVT